MWRVETFFPFLPTPNDPKDMMSALKKVIWGTRAQGMAHSTDMRNKQPQYTKVGGLLKGAFGFSEYNTTDKASERT